MPDIIQEAWDSAAECALLAREASDEPARRFFLSLASSWKKVALNYEVLARNDCYLIELRRAREVELSDRPAEGRRNGRHSARLIDLVHLKMTLRWTIGYFWRGA